MRYLILSALAIALLILVSCSQRKPVRGNLRVNQFLTDLPTLPPTAEIANPGEKFKQLFGNFKTGAKESVIRQTYAEEFYFNDTFKTITTIEELIPYLEETAHNVESTSVEILDVIKGQKDYYLRWVMHMKFKAKQRQVDSRSIGMTQLRFNRHGKVILHQDYWDGAEGFYQHLPYLGALVRKVRDNL